MIAINLSVGDKFSLDSDKFSGNIYEVIQKNPESIIVAMEKNGKTRKCRGNISVVKK